MGTIPVPHIGSKTTSPGLISAISAIQNATGGLRYPFPDPECLCPGTPNKMPATASSSLIWK